MDPIDQHVAACLEGDLDAFEEVVKLSEPKVRAVLAAMIPDSNLVPDLTQEVFVIAYKKLTAYKPGSNFNAWIAAIARNLAQNERRRWYRQQALKEKVQAEAEHKLSDEIEAFVQLLPEDMLESLRDCVGRLGDKTRDILNSYYVEQCSIQKLADLFKVSSSSAKVTLHRARKAVGQCMDGKGKGQ